LNEGVAAGVFSAAMRRTLLLSTLAISALAFAEEQKPKPAEAAKPAEQAAAAKPDPLETIKAETAKLVAEREKISAQIALDQTKLDEKLAPRKRALAEIQIQMEEMKLQLDLAEAERRAKDDPTLVELRRKNEKLLMEYGIAKNEADIDGFKMRLQENTVRSKTSALSLQMELQQKEADARTRGRKWHRANTQTLFPSPRWLQMTWLEVGLGYSALTSVVPKDKNETDYDESMSRRV
jgi:hypothetical protein